MPFRSPYPRLQIPDIDIWSLLYLVFTSDNVDRILLSSEDGSETYSVSTLKETALRFGHGIADQLGFKRSEVLLLVCANSIHVVPAILGTLHAGGIVSPVNPAYGVDELLYQLRDSGATVIVTQQPFLPAVLGAAQRAGIAQENIILLPDFLQPVSLFSPIGKITMFSDVVSTSTVQDTKGCVDATNDTAFLVYTSGTTGLPKGARLTHHNVVSNILMYDAVVSLNPTDVVLAFLPFFHIYGLTILVLQSLYKLARIVVMPSFDLTRFCKAIQLHRVSVAYIVPPVAAMLVQSDLPKRHDMSSVLYMVSGAAKLDTELIESLYSHCNVKLLQGYGLTETSPAAFMMSLAEFPAANGSVGRLLPNQEAKLLDIDDPDVEISSRGRAGEICIRGPNVFKGYHNDLPATEAALTSDGYFRTGDVGIIDEAGHLRVVDRIKELIKFKGYQVAPAELEGILLRHKGVADACVVGVYDEKQRTELPRAYVVRNKAWLPSDQKGCSPDEALALELQDWVAQRAAHYKRLRGGVLFVDELPRTASGKILRRHLKEAKEKARL